MLRTSRRDILRVGVAAIALPGVTVLVPGCAPGEGDGFAENQSKGRDKNSDQSSAMKIQYLEIVTSDVAGACALYSRMHGVTFGDVVEKLGGARTAKLADGGMLGIRGPLRDTEKPVVRPY